MTAFLVRFRASGLALSCNYRSTPGTQASTRQRNDMLLAFGSNGNGQLGLGHREDTHLPTRCIIPDEFPSISPPKCIAAGGNHTFILFPCGRLFVTGSNAYGQCGLPLTVGSLFSTFYKV